MILIICACVIYFLYVVNYGRLYLNRYDKPLHYKKYSIIPAIIYSAVSLSAIIIISGNLGQVGRVLPSPSLNAIFILIGIQFAINKFCSFDGLEEDTDKK